MARFIKKQKQEIGISPDEWLFRGEQKIDKVLLRVIDYDADKLEEKTLYNASDIFII